MQNVETPSPAACRYILHALLWQLQESERQAQLHREFCRRYIRQVGAAVAEGIHRIHASAQPLHPRSKWVVLPKPCRARGICWRQSAGEEAVVQRGLGWFLLQPASAGTALSRVSRVLRGHENAWPDAPH